MSYTFRGVALPDHLKDSIDAYVEDGRPLGGFLAACIDNTLWEAIRRADDDNLQVIPAIMGYLYNECVATCWGYPGASKAWISKKWTINSSKPKEKD